MLTQTMLINTDKLRVLLDQYSSIEQSPLLLPLWDCQQSCSLLINQEQLITLNEELQTAPNVINIGQYAQTSFATDKVIVAVPCFNGETALQITVPSLLAQNYPNVDILLVNDGSTDKSLHVMQELAKQSSNIDVLDLPRGNASITRNTILNQLSDYDFLCWCDCGDQLLPEAVWELIYQAKLRQLSGNRKIVVLPTRQICHANDRKYTAKQPSLGKGTHALKRHLTFLNPFSLHQGGIISKDAISAVLANEGPMYELNQQNGPDFLAGTKLLSQDVEIITLEKVLAIYNIEENTTELGSAENKVIARYPDFVKGMENQIRYFDTYLGNETFKNNAIGSHFFRRANMLFEAGSTELAKQAMASAIKFTPWASRVNELASICDNVDQIIRLFEIFDSSDCPYLELTFFNSTLVLHKKITILRRLLTHGEYENRLLEKALALITQHGVNTFFDLGASVGLYGAIIANNTSVDVIHAYEPTPAHFDLLIRTIQKNGLQEKMYAYKQGVSDRCSEMQLAVAEAFGGANRLVENALPGTSVDLPELHGLSNIIHYDQVTTVEVVSLDEKHKNTNEIIYLKIDIEGHELQALDGASKLLTNNKCIIQVEVAPNAQLQMRQFMTQKGFIFLDTINRDMFFCDKNLIS